MVKKHTHIHKHAHIKELHDCSEISLQAEGTPSGGLWLCLWSSRMEINVLLRIFSSTLFLYLKELRPQHI